MSNPLKDVLKENHFTHPADDVKLASAEPPQGYTALPTKDSENGSLLRWILQSREAEYCNYRGLKMFISTFNVNGQSPEVDLSPLLHADIPSPADIYVLGFQELDLSQQAFLFDYTVREEEWSRIVYMNLCKVGAYFELKRVRMVGIFMLVYALEDIINVVRDVETIVVGTGLLNRLGNKGGVAVRFQLHDSTFCLVNCHFASGVEELERRNQDYRVISKAAFSGPPTAPVRRSIFDHDYIFWFGDMNYRLHNTDRSVMDSALDAHLQFLKHDQLTEMRRKGVIFQDFKEGSITFLPTYKYDKGVDKWDSRHIDPPPQHSSVCHADSCSEKFRVPAWCDRILWCGDKVQQIIYDSVQEIRMSDHRAVRALFDVQAKIVNEEKLKTVFEAALKESDRLENEWLPQVSLDNLEFVFPNASFLQPQCQTLTVTNTGRVPVEFEFKVKPGQNVFCKPWLLVTPESHKIKLGDKCLVDIQVLIDKETVWAINDNREDMYDILVLHLKRGKDFFITINATYVNTCFGLSLDALSWMHYPVREVPTGNLLNLESPVEGQPKKPPEFVPKEIFRLVEHIYRSGLEQDNLFAQAGSHAEFLAIRDALDTGYPEVLPGSVNSAAEALLRLFDSLPEPLVPCTYQHLCLQNVSDYNSCKQAIMKFPRSHKATMSYLLGFLKTVLQHSSRNGCTADILGVIFAPILFRFKSDRLSNFAAKRTHHQQQNVHLAARFIVTLLRTDEA